MIAQTLHGYEQGHRLLATGGHVNEDELAQLDRLSDLSGYVPVGTDFDHYYTGFPCGRYYAFACTWPDRTATRAGTVLTHTLLIPRTELDAIHDLWSVAGHRRPESAFDRAPYTEPLPFDRGHATHGAPTPALQRAAAAITFWFGQPERPVLWIEEGGAEDVVRYLWSLLWQETRESFSFCTFALQVRYLRRQPFGFLVLPPASRGAFHDRARSQAWWIDEQLANAALRERSIQPWVRAIVERGADTTRSMPRFCSTHGLAVPDELAYPVFHRFMELEEPSATRLAAARARADLLERLWPDINPLHPLVGSTLRQLAQRQPDALLAPRPFWDLIDFVKRSAVRPWMEAHRELALEWSAIVGREVERRLVEAEHVEGIGELLHSTPHAAIHEEIIRAVTHFSEQHASEPWFFTKACALLATSVEAKDSSLVSAVIQPLPSEKRSTLALGALEQASAEGRPLLMDYFLTAAHSLGDVDVVVNVLFAEGQAERALEAATLAALAGPVFRPDSLARVLTRFGAEDRFAWSLTIHDARVATWAGKKAAEAAKELDLRLAQIIERCRNAPNEGAVLLACLDERTITDLRDDDLSSTSVIRALAADIEHAPAVKRLAEIVAPQLIRRVADGSWDGKRAQPWFALAALQSVFTKIAPSDLYGMFGKARSSDKDCLPNLARAIGVFVRSGANMSLLWVANVLTKPLQDAYKSSFERAEDDLLILLALPKETEGWLLLAAHLLIAVKRNSTKTAYRLVERVFPLLYGPLARNHLDPACMSVLTTSIVIDWDLAKRWRHWLLDAWLDERWPAASFLRALGEDRALFRRIVYRAWHKRNAKDFIKDLPYALRNDTDLATQWRKPIADFLKDPDTKIDYE